MKIRRAKAGGVTAASVLGVVTRHRDELHRYGVKRLGLFGSVARGEARAGSDLDFIVDLERTTFDDYMGLKLYLEDLFQRKVDLVMEGALKERLRSAILREARYAPGL